MAEDGQEPILGLVGITELPARLLQVVENLFIGPHVAEDSDRSDDVAVPGSWSSGTPLPCAP